MARRRDPGPVEPTAGPARRFLWLRRWLLTAEPTSSTTLAVRAEVERLARLDLEDAERLARLERFLDGRGVLGQAVRFADRRDAAWRRMNSPDHQRRKEEVPWQ